VTRPRRQATAADILAGAGGRNSALAPLAGGAGGELLPLVVRHYLEDGTFEVVEQLPKKGGKDPFPRMLQRGRLPRTLPAVGERAPRLLLPLFHSRTAVHAAGCVSLLTD
jgi:hypothetical protein